MTDTNIYQFLSYDDVDFELVNTWLGLYPELFIPLDIPIASALDGLVKTLNEHPEINGKWMFNFDLPNRCLQQTASFNNPYL